MGAVLLSLLKSLGGSFVSMIVGGSLDKLLATIDKRMDNDVMKDEIKADVTKTWINAQASLLVGRTWWFQLLFVLPLGFWWSAVIVDSIFMFSWQVAALPKPLDDWATYMISALFIVDGGKSLIGSFKK